MWLAAAKRALCAAQELEVVLGDEHISFTTAKIGSLVDVEESKYVSSVWPRHTTTWFIVFGETTCLHSLCVLGLRVALQPCAIQTCCLQS